MSPSSQPASPDQPGPARATVLEEGPLPSPDPLEPPLAPAQTPDRARLRRGYSYMLLASLSFSSMSTLVGLSHRLDPDLSTAMVSLMRALVNLVILLVMAREAPLSLFGDLRPALWLRGLFGALALVMYFSCMARVGVGEGTFLNQTSAVWLALLAPLLLKERTSPLTWLAIAGSMLGVWMLLWPRGAGHEDFLGRSLGAASGLMAAFAYLLVRKAGESNPARVIVFYFTIVSTVASLALFAVEPFAWPANLGTWVALVGVGTLATVGQLLMTRAYQLAPAARVAVLAYATPLLTTLLGALVLTQLPDGLGVVGMGLILACGVAMPFLAARDPRSPLAASAR